MRRCPFIRQFKVPGKREQGNRVVSTENKDTPFCFCATPEGYLNMVVVATGTGGAHKVLLISGKHNGSTASAHGFSRPLSVVLPSAASQASSDSDSNMSVGPPVRKRQRLTHLSPEEKALRRKLKNRVAAQTARDRKKAKMGELEQQVLELELENQKLHIENRLLREKTTGLLTENEELRQRLGLDTLDSKQNVQMLISNVSETDLGTGSSESAALRLRVSAAGAGPAVSKSEDLPMDTDGSDTTDNESDLLLGILDILDPELFLKSCEQECEEPPVLLGGGSDAVPTPAPAAVGAPSVKLEALNELIHFDHIYTKPVDELSDGQCGDDDSDESEGDEEKIFPVSEVGLEEEVCVKDEPEEVVIPSSHSPVDDFLSAASSPALSHPDKEASLADTYSDSGYEGSPSPFSDMSSTLGETTWDDMFANELFPQLISV
ncbi:LOW QUALITY PROTEIN: X-box-binding protein 1 [Boleophthalmus pectinirostris]|uniref:LOW QUALITY PROTEIN: X-box-binding protein 1 n=1 Tax=Boleophthalmus pectinirostris TaxID=150288 RepID=UPI002430C2F2|nr:LOW QUALITY PROTEIN: X-box-binding protein 1 [Boleophthalmus pectinirostris]